MCVCISAGTTFGSSAALNRVLVSNIPRVLSSMDLRDLFAVFGDVASVNIITDGTTKLNIGNGTICFAKSEDARRAQFNAGLLEIAGQKLVVSLAADSPAAAVVAPQAAPVGVLPPSPCVLLRNMFNPIDSHDAKFFDELREDVQGEASKYGKVNDVKVEKNSLVCLFFSFSLFCASFLLCSFVLIFTGSGVHLV